MTDPALRAPSAEIAIDWRQVGLILGARWRIVFRQATSNVGRAILTALSLAFFAGFVVAVAVAAFFGARALRATGSHPGAADALLHAAFFLVFVFLSVSPALGLRGNEFLDVTKLFLYPVNHRTAFAASILGIAASPSVLFLGAPLVAAVLGYGGSAGEVAGGVLVACLVTLTGVAVGQTALLLFLDAFRSRRWRDLSRLLMASFGAALFLVFRLTTGNLSERTIEAAVKAVESWKDWTLPLPSWWGAHAVTGEGWTRWLPALALPVLIVWLVRLAARLQERAYFGDIEERSYAEQASGGGFAGWVGRRVRDPFGAALEKDLRVLLRDPTVRILLIQQLAFSVVPLLGAFWTGASRGAQRGELRAELFLGGIVYLPVLASVGLSLNPLGTEGGGVQHALLTPAPRRAILGGKVVALCLVMGGGLALLVTAASLVLLFLFGDGAFGSTLVRAGLAGLETFTAFGVIAGVGAVSGALFPVRIVTRERRALRQASSGHGGCVRGTANLALLAGASVLCLPLFFAFHHPLVLGAAKVRSEPFLLLSVPLGVVYAAAICAVGIHVGGRIFSGREETVVSELSKSDE